MSIFFKEKLRNKSKRVMFLMWWEISHILFQTHYSSPSTIPGGGKCVFIYLGRMMTITRQGCNFGDYIHVCQLQLGIAYSQYHYFTFYLELRSYIHLSFQNMYVSSENDKIQNWEQLNSHMPKLAISRQPLPRCCLLAAAALPPRERAKGEEELLQR